MTLWPMMIPIDDAPSPWVWMNHSVPGWRPNVSIKAPSRSQRRKMTGSRRSPDFISSAVVGLSRPNKIEPSAKGAT